MLKILVVEDDAQLASTVKYLIEDNPRYRVSAIADDVESAVAAAREHQPHLALVDLHLARGSTGFAVAVRLSDFNVPCLFVSGKPPSYPTPDLALGCLVKPFTAEDVHRALAMAEDKLRGRDALRMRLPVNLTIYDEEASETMEVSGFIPSRASLLTRLGHWIAARQGAS
ncbi:MAG: response regulator [Sphingomonas sp.]|nr:response regulator [Sphingomonas sp.]